MYMYTWEFTSPTRHAFGAVFHIKILQHWPHTSGSIIRIAAEIRTFTGNCENIDHLNVTNTNPLVFTINNGKLFVLAQNVYKSILFSAEVS